MSLMGSINTSFVRQQFKGLSVYVGVCGTSCLCPSTQNYCHKKQTKTAAREETWSVGVLHWLEGKVSGCDQDEDKETNWHQEMPLHCF